MFREILKNVVDETPGATAAVVMGYDGIAVDSYAGLAGDPVTIEAVGMEFSVILSQVRTATQMLQTGPPEAMTIQSSSMVTVFHILNDKYFAAMALTPGGSPGKARYLLKIQAPQLIDELG